MSVGNPKKFEFAKKLVEAQQKEEKAATPSEDLSRVYKDKNHRIKKELSFSTKKNKPKLT